MLHLHTYDEWTTSFHNYDEHVRKIEKNDMRSVDALVGYMEQPISLGDTNRNLYMARSILVWISTMVDWQGKSTLPSEIQKLCEEYSAITFNELCEAANIECKVIIGKGKDLRFVPGETDFGELPQAAWNSFRSGNKWHLVFPDFATTSVVGHSRGGETLLESDGEKLFVESEENTGYMTATLSEFWFCVNPCIFAHHAFPYEKEWQLMPKSKEVTKEDFESSAYLLPGFFMAQLMLLTENKCSLQAKNGRCTITLGCKKSIMNSLTFKYRLSFVSRTGDISGVDPDDLPRMVMYAPGIDSVTFTVRLPVKGEYMFTTLVMSPGLVTNNNCFECRIICHEADPACRKLPIDAEEVGFGFGHIAQDIGLHHPSKTTPTVAVKSLSDEVPGRGEEKLFFKIDHDRVDELEFSSDFVGGLGGDVGYAKTNVDREKGNLEVKTGLKKEGEYGLIIKARDKRAGGNFKDIMNYLVSTRDNDEEEHEQLVKENRKKLTRDKKVEEKTELKSEMNDQVDSAKREIELLRQTLGLTIEDVTDDPFDD